MPRATQAVALVPHPATPCPAVKSIRVDVHRKPQALSLRYVLAGDLQRLRVPAPRPPERVDGLWRHTCFELFLGAPGEPAYQEFNFSPSGEWAAYRFARYREGGTALDCPPPRIGSRMERSLEVQGEVACVLGGTLRLGLSAVVEDEAGALSYWALRHPLAKPDFHHGDAFALELDEARH
jgi:hypothetical protein